MRDELKRCPFCGSEATTRYTLPLNSMASRLSTAAAVVGCSDPECIVYAGMLKPYQTLEDAKREWNRRVEK